MYVYIVEQEYQHDFGACWETQKVYYTQESAETGKAKLFLEWVAAQNNPYPDILLRVYKDAWRISAYEIEGEDG